MQSLINKIHESAKAKGWWEKPREPLAIHMLIVSEIAEATECARMPNIPPIYAFDGDSLTDNTDLILKKNLKPEGELTELADAVIRIMDYCGFKNWDLESAIKLKHEYNLTRSHRHGGKLA